MVPTPRIIAIGIGSLVYTPERRSTVPPSTASPVVLILLALVGHARILFDGKMPQMRLLFYFCGTHRPNGLPVPRGPRTQQEYRYLNDASSCPLCYSAPLIVP